MQPCHATDRVVRLLQVLRVWALILGTFVGSVEDCGQLKWRKAKQSVSCAHVLQPCLVTGSHFALFEWD